MPGFFAQATRKHGRRQKDMDEPPLLPEPVPLRKGKKLRRQHSHLNLRRGEEEEAPVLAPQCPSPPPKMARGRPRLHSKPPKPPVKRLSEEETWARLQQMNPCPAKKRKTVHKPGCLCFLCQRNPSKGDEPMVHGVDSTEAPDAVGADPPQVRQEVPGVHV